MSTRFWYGAGIAALLAAIGVLWGCTTLPVPMSAVSNPERAHQFRAGVGRADLTPPVGYPFFGYSLPAKHVARGFQTRLYARAFYLEGFNGEAVALVQCNLGGLSAAVHRKVASLVAGTTGLGPDRIMIGATHTHSAPGAYFESAMYTHYGTKSPGFDKGLYEYLSAQIADAILEAYRTRVDATAAVGTIDIHGVTFNRSMEAHLANFGDDLIAGDYDVYDAVNPRMTMLRVDRLTDNGTQPLGAFTNFAIHGTVIGSDNDLYNGDCHAAAERYLEAAIRDRYDVPDTAEVIHAMTNGIAGDAAPAFDRKARGFDEANRLGRAIAGKAWELFQSLDDSLDPALPIYRTYREISLRETIYSSEDAPLAEPRPGFPVMGGTEDGYDALHFIWPGAEGSRTMSRDFDLFGIPIALALGPFSWNGIDSSKIFAGSGLHNCLLPPTAMPQLMTLQVFGVGDLMLVATPGEITTVLGERIVDACARAVDTNLGIRNVAIVSLANQYMSYFTTPEEYNQQHYEGAHSLWGAHQGEFVRDELAQLASELGSVDGIDLPDQWTFSPGIRAKFSECDTTVGDKLDVSVVVIDTTYSGARIVRCYYWDEKPSKVSLANQHWRVEVPNGSGAWKTLRVPGIAGSMIDVDDRGLDLCVAVCPKDEEKRILKDHPDTLGEQPKKKRLWCVSWDVRPGELPVRFRFVLAAEIDPVPLLSSE